jgi:hypothetical protein
MKKATFCAIMTLCLCISGCGIFPFRIITGSGTVIDQTKTVAAFTAIELRTVGDMEIVQGDTFGVVVTGESNILDYINVYVDNGTLCIDNDSNVSLNPTQGVRYAVQVVSVNKISSSGTGSIKCDSLAAPTLDLVCSGTGNFAVSKLTTSQLTAYSSGTGSISVGSGTIGSCKVNMSCIGSVSLVSSSTANSIDAVITGTGNLNAQTFPAKAVSVQLNGIGNATVTATDSFDGLVTGTGNITYYGNPPTVKSVCTGSGSIIKK